MYAICLQIVQDLQRLIVPHWYWSQFSRGNAWIYRLKISRQKRVECLRYLTNTYTVGIVHWCPLHVITQPIHRLCVFCHVFQWEMLSAGIFFATHPSKDHFSETSVGDIFPHLWPVPFASGGAPNASEGRNQAILDIRVKLDWCGTILHHVDIWRIFRDLGQLEQMHWEFPLWKGIYI